MEYQDLIEQRYSCRKFTDEALTQSELEAILEAGRVAPSAINRQPWRFLCCREKILPKLMSVPVVVITHPQLFWFALTRKSQLRIRL